MRLGSEEMSDPQPDEGFWFLGNLYNLKSRQQLVKVYGPWRRGKKLFTRGLLKKTDESGNVELTDESAASMLNRVAEDLASYEVRSYAQPAFSRV